MPCHRIESPRGGLSRAASSLPTMAEHLGTDAGANHGSLCYDVAGKLICGWPERHDERFATGSPSLEVGEAARTRRWGLLVHHLVTAVVLAGALGALAVGLLLFTGTIHLQTVLTGSMRPTASPGDVAVTRVVPVDSLRVGDVISFYPPGQTTPVLHRIRSLEATPAGLQITTKGDANNTDDPWHATLKGTSAYRLVAVVPFVGWLTELQRPALLLAGLVLGLVVVLELRKEVKARGMRSQSLPPGS
jgi:signal peptidase I